MLFYTFFLSFLSSPSFAAESRYECPKEIFNEQTAIKDKIPSGWEAKRDFSPVPQRLTNLSVYDGTPEEGARLVPDNEANQNPAKTRWTFPKEKKRSIWLGCEYSGSSLTLVKELPKDVVSCRLLTKGKSEVIGIACK